MNILRRIINREYSGKKKGNAAAKIVIGFAFIILAGALLLMLPIASKQRIFTPFLTAIFTATSATCVTGLIMVDTGAYYSLFGQAVILLLIQFGGLGFMTVLTLAFIAANANIGLRSRMLLAQTMGIENLDGIIRLTKYVLKATALFEGTGAVVLSLRFIPEFGFLKGMWYSVFHSVSAFCNAGFDVLGTGNSIIDYQSDFTVMLTLAILIITGGLGFVVWEDIYNSFRTKRRLSVYSKIVLATTVFMLLLGTVGFYVFERNNEETMNGMTEPVKWLGAFFQAVTTRTAGFDAILQAALKPESKVLSIFLMMVGGASGSTAGGIKVSSFAVAVITLICVLRSQSNVIIGKRRISHRNCIYALSLMLMWMMLIAFGGLFIGVRDNLSLLDSFYEAASAYGTAGLTSGVTANASVPSLILLIMYMFFGRVGILTISVTFAVKGGDRGKIRYPEGNILIG